MNKHLRIEINGVEWVNGDFAEISFTDGPAGVRIEGKPVRTPASGGGGLLDLLTNASRSRTAEVAAQKRATLPVSDQAAEADGVEVVAGD